MAKAKNQATPAPEAPAPVAAEAAPKVERVVQNDIVRPRPESLIGRYWQIADEESAKLGRPAPRRIVNERFAKEVPGAIDATANTQYARWVKFNDAGPILAQLREGERAEKKAAKAAKQNEAKEIREKAKAEKAEAKAAKTKERDEAKAAKAAEREAKAAERANAKANKDAEKAAAKETKAKEREANRAKKEEEKREAAEAKAKAKREADAAKAAATPAAA